MAGVVLQILEYLTTYYSVSWDEGQSGAARRARRDVINVPLPSWQDAGNVDHATRNGEPMTGLKIKVTLRDTSPWAGTASPRVSPGDPSTTEPQTASRGLSSLLKCGHLVKSRSGFNNAHGEGSMKRKCVAKTAGHYVILVGGLI